MHLGCYFSFIFTKIHAVLPKLLPSAASSATENGIKCTLTPSIAISVFTCLQLIHLKDETEPNLVMNGAADLKTSVEPLLSFCLFLLKVLQFHAEAFQNIQCDSLHWD